MKKLFYSIIVAVLASVMVVSLVACGNVNAKNIKGEKVTEEQWVAAFETLMSDESKFTVKYSSVGTENCTHKTMVHSTKWRAKQTQQMTFIKNGALEYLTSTQKVSFKGDKDAAADEIEIKAGKKDVEQYCEIVDGDIYLYEKGRDGKWTKEKAHDSIIYTSTAFGHMISSLLNNFDEYVYSNEHKGYISKNYEDDDDYIVVYKFKNGKLAAIYMYSEGVELTDKAQELKKVTFESEVNITIDYNAKSLSLPNVD